MDRSRRRRFGALWTLVGLALVAVLILDPADGPLATWVTAVTGVAYCLIGASYLLRRPRAWWSPE